MRTKLIFAVLMLLLCGFVACGIDHTEIVETPPETTAPAAPTGILREDLGAYSVVRPDTAQKAELDAAIALRKALHESCAPKIELKTDFYREDIPVFAIGEYEILVGATNRPETAQFLTGCRFLDYGYGIVSGKLVIAGHTPETTARAVELFCANVLTEDAGSRALFLGDDAGVIAPGDYAIKSATVCGNPLNLYTIVYPDEPRFFEDLMAARLAEELAYAIGYVLPVCSASEMTDQSALCLYVGQPTEDASRTDWMQAEDGSVIFDHEGGVMAKGESALGMGRAACLLAACLTVPSNGSDTVACSPATVTVGPDCDTLSAMSFNVYVRDVNEQRQQRVLGQIAIHLPDTFGVQEASDQWMRFLRAELGSYYASVGIGRDDGSGEHSAVFYAKDKFNLLDSGTKWLSATPDVSSKFASSSLNRIFSYALLERKSDGARFLHVNTHLEHTSDEARREQAQVLLAFLEQYPDTPIICTGDFNTHYGGALYQNLTAGRLADAADVAALTEHTATFHNYGKSSTMIDFCFVTEDSVEVLSYKVCNEKITGAYASDHHPVFITYRLGK